MMEVMKIKGNLLQKVPCTLTLMRCWTAPSPPAGHHWPTPPRETPGCSCTSLSQSLVESLLLSPGSWCAQVLFGPSQSLFTQSCVSSGGSVVVLMVTSSKMAYCTQSPCPTAVHCWPVLPQETLNTVLAQSLGPGAHSFTLPTILLGFSFALGCGVSFWWDLTFLLLTPVRA